MDLSLCDNNEGIHFFGVFLLWDTLFYFMEVKQMSLIKCPECERVVSSEAMSCPNCGCPVKSLSSDGMVSIKLPQIVLGLAGLFLSTDAEITNDSGSVLWKGHHGETAKFHINEPVNIKITLRALTKEITGKVYPHKKYACVEDLGVHWKATYHLTEVDIIDA